MNTKSSPSAYRYCIVRLSTVAVSTFVPALNVRSTTLPESTFFRVVRTNAPPLPGLTCWNSTTVHRSPSRLSTRPFLRSFVVAMSVDVSFVAETRRRPEARSSVPTPGASIHVNVAARPLRCGSVPTMLPRSVLPTADVNRTLGLAGSVALAIGGLAAGALPRNDPFNGWPLIRELRVLSPLATAATYLGLVLLIGAWLRLRDTRASPRDLLITLCWWAAPLALAPPLYSRDVYSYIAQGAMVRHGIDAYTHGPAALTGSLPDDVPGIWQFTPAPYGPVYLRLAAGVVGFTGENPVLATLGMRLLALIGLAVIVRCLPPLAEYF